MPASRRSMTIPFHLKKKKKVSWQRENLEFRNLPCSTKGESRAYGQLHPYVSQFRF